jgi:hypothetical protein
MNIRTVTALSHFTQKTKLIQQGRSFSQTSQQLGKNVLQHAPTTTRADDPKPNGRAGLFIKYLAGTIASAYLYDKTLNNNPFTITSLHDGAQGFTSNRRLKLAQREAMTYIKAYHEHQTTPNNQPDNKGLHGQIEQLRQSLTPKLFGENRFESMLDFRSAIHAYLSYTTNTPEARALIENSIECILGKHFQEEAIHQFAPSQRPEQPDLTKTEAYTKHNKYSLSGTPNLETGATGYTSQTITHPFKNRGYSDFSNALKNREESLTPKQSVDTLYNQLQHDPCFSAKSQFAAGQALMIVRKAYEEKKHWGSFHKIIMKELEDRGYMSTQESPELESTRPFRPQDLEKGMLRRNSPVLSPLFYEADLFIQRHILKKPESVHNDLAQQDAKIFKELPFVQLKMNDALTSIEDCSGLGDSYTGYNCIMNINHARILSGKRTLNQEEIGIVTACLNAVYEDTGSIRHTFQELARANFSAGGYKIEDGDAFYDQMCSKAAEAFYAGKKIIHSAP